MRNWSYCWAISARVRAPLLLRASSASTSSAVSFLTVGIAVLLSHATGMRVAFDLVVGMPVLYENLCSKSNTIFSWRCAFSIHRAYSSVLYLKWCLKEFRLPLDKTSAPQGGSANGNENGAVKMSENSRSIPPHPMPHCLV